MREYVFEKVKNTTRHFRFGNVPVYQKDQLPDNVDAQAIFRSVEKLIPSKLFSGLKGVQIGHQEIFDDREANALYKDGVFYITQDQDNAADLIDDIVHEFAHHAEVLYPEQIYGDQKIKKEFLKKRYELEFELRSEGYWTQEYDFKNLKFDEDFDQFLYKRVGKNLLRMITSGMFIRPYSSVSLREYFATGFEQYFLGSKQKLKKISPELYNKIDELVNN
mgnify:FL=1|tara:strand:+ start:474 stop:1133 length:660 start_codon:yes stop_codon:yes gene_type:complete